MHGFTVESQWEVSCASTIDSYWEVKAKLHNRKLVTVHYYPSVQVSKVISVAPYIDANQLSRALEDIKGHIYDYDLSRK